MTTDLVFIDTNVLVYAYDIRDPIKHEIARALVRKLWQDQTGVLSTQVLQEFYSAATQKIKPALPKQYTRTIVSDYGEWCSMDTDPQLLVSASLLQETHQLQWWEALIVEAALRSGATTLLSEDMQHGRKFGQVTIRNPFVES